MSHLTASSRLQRIMALLRDRGELRTGGLIEELGVTPMTVWRDLKLLSEQGLLRRVRGGVRLVAGVQGESDFEAKAVAAEHAKAKIAAAAVAAFVTEGDVIALEGGTTVGALVSALPERRISVVTNSLPVALRLRAQRPGVSVRVIGGWLSAVSGNTTGAEAIKKAEAGSASLCFLSATGWSEKWGPTDPNPLEIEVKRALAAASERVVLLMDSRKFGIRSASAMIHLKRIHALVTEAAPPRPVARQLSEAGVRLIVAR